MFVVNQVLRCIKPSQKLKLDSERQIYQGFRQNNCNLARFLVFARFSHSNMPSTPEIASKWQPLTQCLVLLAENLMAHDSEESVNRIEIRTLLESVTHPQLDHIVANGSIFQIFMEKRSDSIWQLLRLVPSLADGDEVDPPSPDEFKGLSVHVSTNDQDILKDRCQSAIDINFLYESPSIEDISELKRSIQKQFNTEGTHMVMIHQKLTDTPTRSEAEKTIRWAESISEWANQELPNTLFIFIATPNVHLRNDSQLLQRHAQTPVVPLSLPTPSYRMRQGQCVETFNVPSIAVYHHPLLVRRDLHSSFTEREVFQYGKLTCLVAILK